MKKDQSKKPLYDAILEIINTGVTPLIVPSHKNGSAINPGWEQIYKMDLGEMGGLDDIHAPKGVIKKAQELAADAWGADHSFFLVNGTSCGIVASLCALASEGEKVILPRNTHKSAVSGLILGGAKPVYIPAEVYSEKGLVGGIKPDEVENAYIKNPDAKGVFSVTTSYHGICNDNKKIIDITHAHGGLFIADEAHGNHSYFHPDLPKGALTIGADATCQSTHKMSGSLTQSSLLHIKEGKFDIPKLKSYLLMMQTTSPSFLLMGSLDLARSYIATQGKDILGKLIAISSKAREELSKIPGVEILGPEIIGTHAIADYDPIRLVISARQLGIEGYELYKILHKEYKVECEFGDYFYIICVLGLGTTQEHIERLVYAIKDIALKYKGQRTPLHWNEELPPIPLQILTPREAFYSETEQILWKDAKGRISAQMIVPYPPGFATILPGELITDEVWNFLDCLGKQKRKIQGLIDNKLKFVKVVKEK